MVMSVFNFGILNMQKVIRSLNESTNDWLTEIYARQLIGCDALT